MTNEAVTDVAVVDHKPNQVQRASFFNMEPENQIAYAARIATTLAKVISDQGLFTNIQGRKYVKVEGWEVLGSFLGVLPKERMVTELADGSYEAYVDLVRSTDGITVGGASAICGVDEKRWGTADRYARRSMAVTRAVGKAYRTSFSWIISLAGYQPTPAEEMPTIEETKTVTPKPEKYTATEAQNTVLKQYAQEAGAYKGIDDADAKSKVTREIAKAVLGKPMSHLKEAVKNYVEIPFA